MENPMEIAEPMYMRSNGIEVPISSLHNVHLLNIVKKLYKDITILRAGSTGDTGCLSDEEFIESGYPDLLREFHKRGLTLAGPPEQHPEPTIPS